MSNGVPSTGAMRIARVRSPAPRAVAPFLDEPGALPCLGRDLARFQEEEAARAGLRLVDVAAGDALPEGTAALCGDDVLFTAEVLQALRAAAARGGVVQAAIARGTPLHARAAPLCPDGAPDAHLPLPLWAGRLESLRPGDVADATRAVPGAALVPVCDDEAHVPHRVDPYGPAPHVLAVPCGDRVAGRFAHWLHVLDLGLALTARETRRAGARGRRGRAKVHPTALVERSVLEDGVEIDAHASVIDSWIGAGARIAERSVVHSSSIGASCQTLVDTHLRRVVAMSGSTLSNLSLEDVVVGREVFVTTATTFFPGAPRETVVVDGVDTGRPCLGGAIGHRAILGARALFSAGVAVPSGAVVVMRPDEGATRLDDEGLARASMRRGDPSVDA